MALDISSQLHLVVGPFSLLCNSCFFPPFPPCPVSSISWYYFLIISPPSPFLHHPSSIPHHTSLVVDLAHAYLSKSFFFFSPIVLCFFLLYDSNTGFSSIPWIAIWYSYSSLMAISPFAYYYCYNHYFKRALGGQLSGSVKHLTVDFSIGHDLGVMRSHSAWSLLEFYSLWPCSAHGRMLCL